MSEVAHIYNMKVSDEEYDVILTALDWFNRCKPFILEMSEHLALLEAGDTRNKEE